MKTARSLAELRSIRVPLVVAAGFFDGVHRGHMRVIKTAAAAAARMRGEAWALTFDPHPARILSPGLAPGLLTSLEHKLLLLEKTGLDGCAVLRFNRALAALTPGEFINKLKDSAPSLRELVVGETWSFGRGAKGDVPTLRRLAAAHGFKVKAAPQLFWRGAPVSSTRIRECVSRGDLKQAEKMLGRPFSVFGAVKSGRGMGRKLGFPTANLDTASEIRPPLGVYAVRAVFEGQSRPGALNIGFAPTVRVCRRAAATAPVMELHLPGIEIDLLGKKVEAIFLARLRAEKKFSSVAALKNAIRDDIAEALELARRAGRRRG